MNELRANRPDLSAMSDRELIERGLDLADQYMEMLFTEHIFISFLATLPIGIITSVCEAVGRPGDTLKLLAGLGDVESAAPAMAMWDLGRMAAASPDVSALFDAGYAGLHERLVGSESPDAAAFLEAFDDFSFRYGCRGPNEWEARSPTWETEPDLALAAIDRMRLSDETAAPKVHNAERAAERESIGAEITAMLDGKPEDQQKFQAALHSATVFMPGRERTKTNNIKLIQELRVALHEFGRRRVADGTFHKANDFGLLTRGGADRGDRRSRQVHRCARRARGVDGRGGCTAGAVPVPWRSPRHEHVSRAVMRSRSPRSSGANS